MEHLQLIGRSEELFSSDVRNLDRHLTSTVKESRFLIIGGAGSIGQAVVKEIFRRDPIALHVVDISHPNFEDHIASVNSILADIKCHDKPTFMVFNKIDAYKYETIAEEDLETQKGKEHYTLQDWQKTWMNDKEIASIFISALNKENLEDFKDKTYEEVKKIHIQRFPYNDFLYYEYKEE